jgi:hypothetical protein
MAVTTPTGPPGLGRGSPDSRLGEPSQLYPRGHLRCVTQASETMQPMAVGKSNVVQEASIAGPSMALFPGRDDWNRARADADLTTTGHGDTRRPTKCPTADRHPDELPTSTRPRQPPTSGRILSTELQGHATQRPTGLGPRAQRTGLQPSWRLTDSVTKADGAWVSPFGTTGARIGCPIPPPRQGWDRGE